VQRTFGFWIHDEKCPFGGDFFSDVQRTFGFWIDDEKNPCYVDFFSLSASHLNPNLVRCRLPFWVHLGMHQNTNILEEVPIYHKTRSAMHLFLTPHQMCNALLVSGGSLVISLFQVSSPSLSASHLNPNLVRCRLPFWVHLEMHQNTNILEAVPIYHKTRSAMHLFLTPHQKGATHFWILD
jgi:hypothetical protein